MDDMNKINKMDKKSKFVSDIIFVFSYFLSGAILINPCYTGAKPIFAFVFLLIIYVVCIVITLKCLKRQKSNKNSFVAFLLFVMSVFVLLIYLNKYIENFDVFFEYERNIFALIISTLVVLACAAYGAKSGHISVTGFASISALGFVLWRIMGMFGFFTTKKFMPIDFSFEALSLDAKLLWDMLAVLIFTVCDFGVLYRFFRTGKSENCGENSRARKSLLGGSLAFLGFEYINTVKNMSLFGKEVLPKISNPDLASVRLFPFFELPEISVIVFMFALVTKLSVYFFFYIRFFEKIPVKRHTKTK